MIPFIITLALHIGGAVLGLILTTPVKPPKRWSPGDTKETRLDGKHPVYWHPMD